MKKTVLNTCLSFFLCFLVIVFPNCRHKQEIGKVLVTDCYWDIIEKSAGHDIYSCYKFDTGGRCRYFMYRFYDKKRTDSVFHFDDGDVVVPDKWELKNDSDLIIRGLIYHLLKYNADSVIFSDLRRDTTILIKNCRTSFAQKKPQQSSL